MIPGHGKFPVTGTDIPELHHGFVHTVELAVYEIPRGDEEIRLCLADLPEYRGEPFLPHQNTDMNVGNLDNPDLSDFFWDFI